MRSRGGSIQNRGTSWRISYYGIDHQRQFESYPTEDEARRELAKRISQVADGIPVTSKPHLVKFEELANDMLADMQVNRRRSYPNVEAKFRLYINPVFGRHRAMQITTAQLNHYIIRRLAETPKPKPGTVNSEMAAIRRAFKLALEGGKILRMPKVPKLKDGAVRTGFFTQGEVERLCSHLKAPLDSFVLFAFKTGWRREEIASLTWDRVDWQAGEIRLDPGTTKNTEGRVFPLSTELRALLEKQRKAKHAFSQHVFTKNGLPIGDFRKAWLRACHKAGLPCILGINGKPIKALRIFHDLRRSAVRTWILAGMPEKTAMMLSGHKSRSMLSRYAIITAEDLREAVRFLEPSGDHVKFKTS